MSMEITYGTHTLDFDALPIASRNALARRGLAHVLGNEVASKVTSHFKAENYSEGETVPEDTEVAREAKKAEFQAEAMKKIMEGTLGVSMRGPSVDPLEAEINSICRKEVLKQLADNNLKAPKKADDTVKTASGEFTIAQLIHRRLHTVKGAAENLERITREAKASLEAKAREKAKMEKKLAAVVNAADEF